MDSKPMAYLYVCVTHTHTGSDVNIFIDLKPFLSFVSEAHVQ